MDEVDYSKFVYKRENENSNVTPRTSLESTQYEINKKPKKRGNFFFVFFVVLLCFALVLLATDIISNGKIMSAITASLQHNAYEYYLVAIKCSGNSDAYAKSLSVKTGGGAGYIYSDEALYTVLSAFCSLEDAEKVLRKNSDAEIVTVSRKSSNSFYNSMNEYLKEFCGILISYDEGSVSDSTLTGTVERLRNSVIKLQDNGKTSDKSKSDLCEFVISGLESLKTFDGVKSEYLGKARYFLVGWAVSFCK